MSQEATAFKERVDETLFRMPPCFQDAPSISPEDRFAFDFTLFPDDYQAPRAEVSSRQGHHIYQRNPFTTPPPQASDFPYFNHPTNIYNSPPQIATPRIPGVSLITPRDIGDVRLEVSFSDGTLVELIHPLGEHPWDASERFCQEHGLELGDVELIAIKLEQLRGDLISKRYKQNDAPFSQDQANTMPDPMSPYPMLPAPAMPISTMPVSMEPAMPMDPVLFYADFAIPSFDSPREAEITETSPFYWPAKQAKRPSTPTPGPRPIAKRKSISHPSLPCQPRPPTNVKPKSKPKSKSKRRPKPCPNDPTLPGPFSQLIHLHPDIRPRDVEAWVRRTTRPEEAARSKDGRIGRINNVFFIYRWAYVDMAKRYDPKGNGSQQMVSKLTKVSWGMEMDEVRKRFEKLAELEKEMHASAFPGYIYRPDNSGRELKRKKQ